MAPTAPLQRVVAVRYRFKLSLPPSAIPIVGGVLVLGLGLWGFVLQQLINSFALSGPAWGLTTASVVLPLLMVFIARTLINAVRESARSLFRVYNFTVGSQRFARQVEFSPPQTVRVTGLRQLAGKALLVTLSENTRFPLVPPPRSFRLYRPPALPPTVLRVCLYGLGEDGEILLLDTADREADPPGFEVENTASDFETDPEKRLLIPVQADFPGYALEFSFADALSLIAQEVVCTTNLKFSLEIALREKDFSRCYEPSIQDAQLTLLATPDRDNTASVTADHTTANHTTMNESGARTPALAAWSTRLPAS